MRALLCLCCSMLALVALVAAGCGSSIDRMEWRQDDPAGDVAAAAGPDVVAVTLRRDDEAITFLVRFATPPPLAASEEEGWVDMLLIGVDVWPFGLPPATPGGEWRGADYAFGTHGPAREGMFVRLTSGGAGAEERADIPVETAGTTLSVSLPRDAFGDAGPLAISIAAAREWNEPGDVPAGATPDVVPDAGTWTVELE